MKVKEGKLIYTWSNNYARNDPDMWDVEVRIKFPPMNSEDYFDLMASMTDSQHPKPNEDQLGVLVVFKEKKEIKK